MSLNKMNENEIENMKSYTIGEKSIYINVIKINDFEML